MKRRVIVNLGGHNFIVGFLLTVFLDLNKKTRCVVQDPTTMELSMPSWDQVSPYDEGKKMFPLQRERMFPR